MRCMGERAHGLGRGMAMAREPEGIVVAVFGAALGLGHFTLICTTNTKFIAVLDRYNIMSAMFLPIDFF